MYLIQEHELKSKQPRAFYYRLPPLRTLDQVLHQTMAFGFISVTLGLIVASIYAASHWGQELDRRPDHRAGVCHLGDLPGDDFQPSSDRMARAQERLFCDRRFLRRRTDLDRQQRSARVHAAMSVLVLGLSHKTAPVEVRERFALPEERAEALLASLAARPGIDEACILSTCNRVEFMVRGDDASGPETALLTFLNEDHHAPVVEATPFLYRYADREAIRHIFRVASSLDSMVVGEPQILGQVKTAYQAAKQAGAIRGPLDHLLTAAFRVARRVRNETGIGQMAVSISYVAVELARKIFGDLDGLNVLIIGAGKMSELTARHLAGAGAKKPFVINRTFEKAQEMAKVFSGEAVPYDRLHEMLSKVDVVISSTGAPGFVLTKESLTSVAAARKGRPLFLVDIAVPRDIDPAINKLDEMFVYDIDDLQHVADANLEQRKGEAERAEKIVEEELDKLMHRLKTHQVAPTIVSLQGELERLRQSEIERHRSKLGTLTPEQEEAVEALTRSMINKIAHSPISQMKRLASHPDGLHFVEFVKRAFNRSPARGVGPGKMKKHDVLQHTILMLFMIV